MLRIAALSFACFGSACVAGEPAPPRTPADASLVAQGREIAVAQCADCHAIDGERTSPRAGAPPMRAMLDRYDADMLAQDFIEGVRVGHDDMPHFDMTVAAADALIAYLRSIE